MRLYSFCNYFIFNIFKLLHKVTNNSSYLYLIKKKSGNFAVTYISNLKVTYGKE